MGLLQVLMPKLLKMHEAKYDPMEKADAEAIMEEILGMQCGLNPDQQADANEEAEMIIRAIMQDEVDKSVYAKMADDLERAATKLKKRNVKIRSYLLLNFNWICSYNSNLLEVCITFLFQF